MQANVIKAFRDKENEKKYVAKGSVFEATEKRIKELAERGFLELENNDEPPSLLDGNVEEVKNKVDGLTVDEVKELLETEKAGGNRKGLINHFESLIEAAESKPPEEGE